jgi:hypothetical protein
MLMTHPNHHVHTPVVSGSPEVELSPDEVSRRILEVRSSWNVRERMVRRRAAADRFEDLVAVLADYESR